jgi:hypothetical protein
MALKALIEWTRGLALGAGGYQQLQADLATLHLALPFLVNAPTAAAAGLAGVAAAGGGSHTHAHSTLGGSSASGGGAYDPYLAAGHLEELLNEAAVSAGERCVDPRPLELAILTALAGAKLARLNMSI